LIPASDGSYCGLVVGMNWIPRTARAIGIELQLAVAADDADDIAFWGGALDIFLGAQSAQRRAA